MAERVGGAPVIEVCFLLCTLKMSHNVNFDKVDPCEANFPGLEKLEEDLKGWQWTFAKSPKFTLISGAQEIQVAAGKVVTTRHVLQKGVPDIVGLKFDAELADLLEGSWKTRMLANHLRKIT